MTTDIDDLDAYEATLRRLLNEIWTLKGRQWRSLHDDPLFSILRKMGNFLYAMGGRAAMHEVANVRVIRPMPWDPRRRNYIDIVDHSWDGIGAGADCWRA